VAEEELDRLATEADAAMHAGWYEVADRMDRWGANDYAGDWQDPQYDPPREAVR
jgi:hypothetical protein